MEAAETKGLPTYPGQEDQHDSAGFFVRYEGLIATESQDLQHVPFLQHSTFALRCVALSVTIRSWLGCLPQKKPEDIADDHFDWEEELKHLGEEIVADSSDSHAAPAADKNPGSAADTSEKAGGADAGKGSA